MFIARLKAIVEWFVVLSGAVWPGTKDISVNVFLENSALIKKRGKEKSCERKILEMSVSLHHSDQLTSHLFTGNALCSPEDGAERLGSAEAHCAAFTSTLPLRR